MLFNHRCLQDYLGSSTDRLPTRCYYNLLWPTNNWPCLQMKPGKNHLPPLMGTSQISKILVGFPPPPNDALTQHEVARTNGAHITNKRLER
jgi:hypothetical protein